MYIYTHMWLQFLPVISNLSPFFWSEFELPPNGCWFRNTFQKLEDLSALEFMLVFLAPIIFAEGDWDLLKVIFFGTLSEN